MKGLSKVRQRGGLPTALAMFLCACSPSDDGQFAGGNDAEDAVATNFVNRMVGTEEPVPASKAIAKPFEQSQKTGSLEFLYSWPAQAAAVPAIAKKLQRHMNIARADALKMAEEDQKAARQSNFPFHRHSLETRWSITADTPRFLALQSTTHGYTGGAHGMTSYDTLLWDKARARETSFEAVMTSPAAFAAAIRDRFCTGLDKARAARRGGPVQTGDDPFTKCIDPMKEVLAPTSRDGKLIDGITVVIAPYSAGPYSEGTYEVKLPVDAAMHGAIKTEYQDAFAGAQ